MNEYDKKINSLKKKATTSIEQIGKFKQKMKRRKQNIENKFMKSIMNQLYIFPRVGNKLDVSTQLSSDSEEEICCQYDLRKQNEVSRKNQTNLQKIGNFQKNKDKSKIKKNRKCKKNGSFVEEFMSDYHSTKSVKSVQSMKNQNKMQKNPKSKIKNKNIEIIFNTKKKSPAKKKVNSQTKLLVEQYSLDNRIYQNLNKSNKGLMISYRPTKNHEINVSLSSKKVLKTTTH